MLPAPRGLKRAYVFRGPGEAGAWLWSGYLSRIEPDRVWATWWGGQKIGLEPGSWVLALVSSLIHCVPWVVMAPSASVSSTGKMK